MPVTSSDAGSMFAPSNGRHVVADTLLHREPALGIEIHQHGRDFQQRIRLCVEAAGFEIDHHRQETAEAFADR